VLHSSSALSRLTAHTARKRKRRAQGRFAVSKTTETKKKVAAVYFSSNMAILLKKQLAHAIADKILLLCDNTNGQELGCAIFSDIRLKKSLVRTMCY
jgi:hypothetical protein